MNVGGEGGAHTLEIDVLGHSSVTLVFKGNLKPLRWSSCTEKKKHTHTHQTECEVGRPKAVMSLMKWYLRTILTYIRLVYSCFAHCSELGT